MHTDNWDEGLPPAHWQNLTYDEKRRRGNGRLSHLADQHDEKERRLTRALNPPRPKPVHEATLEWLDAMAGGRSSLLSMTGEPLAATTQPTDDEASASEQQRLALLWHRLEPLDDLFGEESLRAAHALVHLLWREDRAALTLPTTDRVLAGIVWVIARANDLFTRAAVTHAVVREVLDLSAPLTPNGQALHRSIGGLPAAVGSPQHQPDLLAVGRVEVLTAVTRRRLIRLRDQALEAASVAPPPAPVATASGM